MEILPSTLRACVRRIWFDPALRVTAFVPSAQADAWVMSWFSVMVTEVGVLAPLTVMFPRILPALERTIGPLVSSVVVPRVNQSPVAAAWVIPAVSSSRMLTAPAPVPFWVIFRLPRMFAKEPPRVIACPSVVTRFTGDVVPLFALNVQVFPWVMASFSVILTEDGTLLLATSVMIETAPNTLLA